MDYKFNCAVCGTEFNSMRSHAKICSMKCRKIWSRKKHRVYYLKNRGHITSLHKEYIQNWQRTHKDAMNSYALKKNRMNLLKLLIKMGFSEKAKELLMRERPIFRKDTTVKS